MMPSGTLGVILNMLRIKRMKSRKVLSVLVFCLVFTGCTSVRSCFDDVHCVWNGGSGSVPKTTPAPSGFEISPATAHMITEQHYGPRINVWHIYADSENYYVIDGFFGSNSARAIHDGLIINGSTGERFDRGTDQWLPNPIKKDTEDFGQNSSQDG